MIKRFFAFFLVLSLLGLTLQTLSFAEGNADFIVDENGVLMSYIGESTDVIIPNDMGITAIGIQAFAMSNITSVSIPNTVTKIYEAAFFGCAGLTTINIPESVTNIYDGAFYMCTGLTSVSISEGVSVIGVSAFEGCTGLTSLKLPSTISNINSDAFKGCSNLSNVYFLGNAPIISSDDIFNGVNPSLTIYHIEDKFGFSAQQWNAYNLKAIKLGDVNGDSSIDIDDLAAIKMHLLKQYFLIDEHKIAADIFQNNMITISDLMAVKKMILNINLVR